MKLKHGLKLCFFCLRRGWDVYCLMALSCIYSFGYGKNVCWVWGEELGNTGWKCVCVCVFYCFGRDWECYFLSEVLIYIYVFGMI